MCETKTYYFITKKGIIVKHLVIFFVKTCAVLTYAFHHSASSRHATPGSSLPSRNSRDAPPPVEM